jgi:hypothetical protein
MTGFDKDECFIKEDGFKDNSEDTTDEEMMKQDKAPKTQEGIKKELASAADITDAPDTETEIQEGVLEDTVEADKDETDVELEIERQKRFRSIVGSPNWLAISALPDLLQGHDSGYQVRQG